MFSKKLLIPLLSLSLLVTPAYSSHAAENAEAAGTSVEGQGMLSPSSSSESSESVFNGSGAGTSSEPVTDEKLETILKQVQSQLPAENGTWAVFISDLVNGTEGSLNDQKMQAASLIKLYIMGAVYENYDQITGQYGRDSVDSNLYSMITVSDNDVFENPILAKGTIAVAKALAETDAITIIGGGDSAAGMQAVNSFCQAHGYDQTHMGRMLLASNENDDNYTSVGDCGHLLQEIYKQDTSGYTHATDMFNLLKAQTRCNKIPAQLPEGVKTANKTGELDNVENDAGIIYDSKNDVVIVFMSQNLSSAGSAQNTIATLSRTIYDYYN